MIKINDFACNRFRRHGMEEVERLVRGGEPVLLIGSPMCWAFSKLIELTRATAKLVEVKYKSLVVEFFLLQDVRDGAECRTWDAWSHGRSFVKEMPGKDGVMQEKDGVHKTKVNLCRFELTTNSVGKGSWFMSASGCIIEELCLPRWTSRELCLFCLKVAPEGWNMMWRLAPT